MRCLNFILLAFCIFGNLYNMRAQNFSEMKNINIAGIVVDSETLMPLENTSIYDGKDNLLAVTDKQGYFKTSLKVINIMEEEYTFLLQLDKDNYNKFIQKERWGNFEKDMGCIYYFSLQSKTSSSNPDSELLFNKKNLSYNFLLEGLEKFKNKLTFDYKLESKKTGNNNVFFSIDKELYIISDTGWIKIDSEEDLVSLNERKNVKAKELNQNLQRSNIIGMSPSESEDYKYVIYTIESNSKILK